MIGSRDGVGGSAINSVFSKNTPRMQHGRKGQHLARTLQFVGGKKCKTSSDFLPPKNDEIKKDYLQIIGVFFRAKMSTRTVKCDQK
jgi:hypothetical protein